LEPSIDFVSLRDHIRHVEAFPRRAAAAASCFYTSGEEKKQEAAVGQALHQAGEAFLPPDPLGR
jgi:hypothetical protein